MTYSQIPGMRAQISLRGIVQLTTVATQCIYRPSAELESQWQWQRWPLQGGAADTCREQTLLHLMLNCHHSLKSPKEKAERETETETERETLNMHVQGPDCLFLENCWLEWQQGLRSACLYHFVVSTEGSAFCSVLSSESDNAWLGLICTFLFR